MVEDRIITKLRSTSMIDAEELTIYITGRWIMVIDVEDRSLQIYKAIVMGADKNR